jgi:hypothetical protein
VDEAKSWAALAEQVKNLQANNAVAEAEEQEPEEFVPQLAGVYKYKVRNPKTKKVTEVEVEVTKLYSKVKQVDVKNLDDGKTVYPKVPYDQLIEG